MMIRISAVTTAIMAVAFFSLAQNPGPLHVQIFTLDNGLTVYLNEDHSLPNVFGAVVVRGGSKCDPVHATGIAHYFEHIMFKGTDEIGTTEYESEKIYLDSIAALYDRLAATTGVEEQTAIQKEINRLSVKASEYAIPNEFDRILEEMGGTDINAGTGNEEIVYYNIFPGNQIEKWLEVYSHRFIHPVYRLFQAELETVYEEYNMYADDRIATAFEKFIQRFYPDHPYGIPILGYPEHLKNPSMSEMDRYFRTYYVANNMALVLSGDFDPELVKPVIREKFGRWRSGDIPSMPENYRVEPFAKREVLKKRLTPVRFGILGFRSVPVNHEDGPALDVLGRMMSNEAGTGFLDKLVSDNRLMMATVMGDRYTEAGGEYLIFVPRIIGQSLKKAERLVMDELQKLKTGGFGDDLLEGVKTEIMVGYEQMFENQYNRGYMMCEAFSQGIPWEDVLDYPEKISNISREDILSVAERYFGGKYLAFYSKMGLPKKPKTLRPPFEPIPPKNKEMKSRFAQRLEEMEVSQTEPDFIEFGNEYSGDVDVVMKDITDLAHLYWVENRINDVFHLKIRFGIGTWEMPVLRQVAEYLQLIGTGAHDYDEFNRLLQTRGCSYYIMASGDYFELMIIGMDEHLEESVELIAGLLYDPRPDDRKLNNLLQSAKLNNKFALQDPETMGEVVFRYAVHGERSPYLNRLSEKEVKTLQSSALLQALQTVVTCEADIHYSGTAGMGEVERIIRDKLELDRIRVKSTSPVKDKFRAYDRPTVFFLSDDKPIQSRNYFYLPGEITDEPGKAYLDAYYEYLDGGMHSIIFQEIREFRSLAYATGGWVYKPFYPDERTFMIAYVGTQADKTREAVETMAGIL
ncbi:MAG: insulinase family protein, partial [Bacteroidales bacterium]|nr:insulinase family protein [Bacteroidales bacterium]